MKTSIITSVTFDKSLKTVTFSEFTTIDQNRIVSVHNITRSAQIYSNKLSSLGGSVATNVLTLVYDTDKDNWSDGDSLLVEYIIDHLEETATVSTARIATGQTGTLICHGKGVMIAIDVTAVSGTTPAMVVKVQAWDPVSVQFIDIPDAVTASINATGQKILTIHPGCDASANVRVPAFVPRKYRIKWDITGTTPSFTFSVGVHHIV